MFTNVLDAFIQMQRALWFTVVVAGHDHLPDRDKAKVHEIRETLRTRAATENVPIPQIYRDEIVQLANNPVAAGMMPTLPSVTSTMYKNRHSTISPLPQTRQAILIPPAFQLTSAGQRFLLAQHANDDYIIFATGTNLTTLSQADTI